MQKAQGLQMDAHRKDGMISLQAKAESLDATYT
jgi:hypothetical protein